MQSFKYIFCLKLDFYLMTQIHLEKRSEALQMQITESNRNTVVLRHEKDKCDLDLNTKESIQNELQNGLSSCEETRTYMEETLVSLLSGDVAFSKYRELVMLTNLLP